MSKIDLNFNPSTYAGEALQEVIAQQVLRGNTISEGLVTVHDDIRFKQVIPTLSGGVTIQDGSESFDHAGTTAMSEKYLEPESFKVNEKYNYRNLSATWAASRQPSGERGKYVPPTDIESAIIELKGRQVGKFIDASIWGGSAFASGLSDITKTGSNEVTGLLAKAEANADTVKLAPTAGSGSLVVTGISKAAVAVVTVASTTNLQSGDKVTFNGVETDGAGTDFETLNGNSFAITVLSGTTFSIPVNTSAFDNTYDASSGTISFINVSNAISILTEIYNAMPFDAEFDPAFRLFGNRRLLKAYSVAQATKADGAGSFFIGEKELDFLGTRIAIVPYMPDNMFLGAKTSDLHFGTALESDFTNFNIVDLRETTNELMYSYRLDFGFDVEITNNKDTLLYK